MCIFQESNKTQFEHTNINNFNLTYLHKQLQQKSVIDKKVFLIILIVYCYFIFSRNIVNFRYALDF